jgi:hypothetical protein
MIDAAMPRRLRVAHIAALICIRRGESAVAGDQLGQIGAADSRQGRHGSWQEFQ